MVPVKSLSDSLRMLPLKLPSQYAEFASQSELVRTGSSQTQPKSHRALRSCNFGDAASSRGD